MQLSKLLQCLRYTFWEISGTYSVTWIQLNSVNWIRSDWHGLTTFNSGVQLSKSPQCLEFKTFWFNSVKHKCAGWINILWDHLVSENFYLKDLKFFFNLKDLKINLRQMFDLFNSLLLESRSLYLGFRFRRSKNVSQF